MNKLIMTLLVACTFVAKAPKEDKLPYESRVKSALSYELKKFKPAFQEEMRSLLIQLKEKGNKDDRNNFIKEIITNYCNDEVIFPRKYIKINELNLKDRARHYIDTIPIDGPDKETNQGLRDAISALYDKNISTTCKSFELDTNYFFLQATLLTLEQISRCNQEKWASKMFAICYLRLFLDLDEKQTDQRICEIIETFDLSLNR